MPKQDRIAPVRPPWLPEEDDHRRGLFRRRRKAEQKPEATPAGREKALTTPEPEAASPKADGANGSARKALEEVTSQTAQQKRGDSNYYVPARSDSSEGERPGTEGVESGVECSEPELGSAPTRIVSPPHQSPERATTSALRSEASRTSPAEASEQVSLSESSSVAPEAEFEFLQTSGDPDVVATDASVLELPEVPLAMPTAESIFQPEIPDPEPVGPTDVVTPPPAAPGTLGEPGGADPFSRFSELEAKLRQMGFDESIPEESSVSGPRIDDTAGVEDGQARRFILPEWLGAELDPELPVSQSVSFVHQEDRAAAVVSDGDEPPRSRHAAPEEVETGEKPYGIDDLTRPESEIVDPEAERAAPESGAGPTAPGPFVVPEHQVNPEFAAADQETEPEVPEALVVPKPESFVPESQSVPGLVVPEVELDEPESEQKPAQLPPVEIPHSSEADEIDARAAALLQRIEAKRAELNRDIAAVSEPDAQSEPIVVEQDPEVRVPATMAPSRFAPEPEPEPEEPADLAPDFEPEASVVEQKHVWEPQPVEADPVAMVFDTDLERAAVLEQESEVTVVEAKSASEYAECEPESGPDAVAHEPVPKPDSGQSLELSESVPIPQLEREQAAAVELEGAQVPPVPESPIAMSESVGSQELSSSDAESPHGGVKELREETRSPRPAGRRLATPPWQIPNAVQQAPAIEPPPGPAYYVPPQQPAAQVPPPGWVPAQPQQWPPQNPQPPAMPAPPMNLDPYVPPQVQGGEAPWVQGQPPVGPPPQQLNQMPPPGWVPAPVQPQQQPMHPVHQEGPSLAPGHLPPPQFNAPPANYQAPQAYRMPPSLDEAAIINRGLHAPRSGWRRAVHRASAGHVNPGDSRKDRERDDLLARIRQPILGDYRIAVLSIKGGVGKTTTTLGLGSAFATVRTDRIIAVDANPDRGTLAERVRNQSTHSTVRDLLNDDHINSYADVRNHTRMATSRLEVLASEQDPAVSEAFGEVDYRHTVEILQRYYNIILTDCGTGIMHSAMTGVLDLAHTIVLVSSPAMDAARSASATLDWLMQHGHSGLVREAHVVLSASRPGSAGIKLDKVYEHFEARCRSIHLVPFDPHLAEGADVDFNLLGPATNEAYLGLAGAIAENFPRLRTHEQHM